MEYNYIITMSEVTEFYLSLYPNKDMIDTSLEDYNYFMLTESEYIDLLNNQ